VAFNQETEERLKAALADRYAIEREIGSGGMATVYLANDLKHERKVALKVLRSDLAASLGAERFLQEVRVTANLTHPHILPLHDSGEADGFLFYVMPYIEGESLRERLVREHELPVTEAARLLRDVLDALAAAHKLGVVHRDIKPENVLISGRHAMVADFGVAKAVSEATGRHKLTTLGVALGTPSYMAPEQAAADEAIDHRADIYAVGVMAYELLAGRPPFTGSTPQQVLAAQVMESPKPVTELRASVPPALETLIMRCLEKKPADRWQSAEELLPHLEALATPSGGVTPTETVPFVAAPRNKAALRIGAAVAAVIVVVATAIVFGLGIWSGGDGAPTTGDAQSGRVAVLPFVSRSPDAADAFLAEALAEQVGIRLGRLQQLRVLSAAAVAAQMRRTPDPLEAAQVLQTEWFVTGSLRRATDELYAHLEVVRSASGVQTWANAFTRSDGDLAALEQEVSKAVAVALVGTVEPDEAEALQARASENQEAYRLFLLAKALYNRRTQETVAQAVEHLQEVVRLDPTFAQAWAVLGRTRIVQYSWTSWEADVPRDSLPVLARMAIGRALALDSLCAIAWAAEGGVAGWADREFSRARTSFERALELDSLNAEILHAYGVVLGADLLNELPSAERVLRRAVEMEPDRLNTWRHLALAIRNQGRLAAAEALCDTTVSLGQWAPAYEERGYVRFLRGDGAGALADLAENERLGGDDVENWRALYSIAVGDSLPARAWLEQHRGQENEETDSLWSIRFSTALGQLDNALVLLEGQPRDVSTWSWLHNPIFTPLRDDPRFVRLLEESRPGGR